MTEYRGPLLTVYIIGYLQQRLRDAFIKIKRTEMMAVLSTVGLVIARCKIGNLYRLDNSYSLLYLFFYRGL